MAQIRLHQDLILALHYDHASGAVILKRVPTDHGGITDERMREWELVLPDHVETDPQWQAAADKIWAATNAAQAHSGIKLSDTVYVNPQGGVIGINVDKDPPPIYVGIDYFLHPEKFTQNEIESIILHELGHTHYRPLIKEFKYIANTADTLAIFNDIQEMFDANPEEMTARLLKASLLPEPKFLANDFSRASAEMDQYITLSQTHPIVTATDEEVATWVLGGIKAAHHGGDLPEPLQDMYSFQTPRAAEAAAGAVIMGMKRDVTLEDIDECRPHVEAVRQILAEHLPKLISAGEFSKNTFLKLKRGEELLCDDFAVIHSQDPLAVATGFEKLFLNHGGDSKHPPNATRLGRSTKLARRVIAGREMLGRETASKELLEPLTLEPATYRQWTNDIAKVSGTVKDAADTIPLPPQ